MQKEIDACNTLIDFLIDSAWSSQRARALDIINNLRAQIETELATMAEEKMALTWCITFPVYHPLADCWIEIIAADYSAARHAAFTMFGPRYGAIYSADSFREQGNLFRGGRVGRIINALDIPGGAS